MKWINPSSNHQWSSLFVMDYLLSSCSVIFISEAIGKAKYRLCLQSTYSAPLQNYSLIYFFICPRNRSPFFPLWIFFKVMLNPEEKSTFTWYWVNCCLSAKPQYLFSVRATTLLHAVPFAPMCGKCTMQLIPQPKARLA